MISIERAWPRIRQNPQFKNFELADFRTMAFGQQLSCPAGAGSTPGSIGPSTRNFPGGAIILGVTASATPSTFGAGDAFLYRKSFALQFGYTNGESLSSGDFISADALTGGGDGTTWPTKEIVVAPNQGIQATANCYITTALLIQITYHAVVWRTAS